jgi:leucyl-tRNA synthetase
MFVLFAAPPEREVDWRSEGAEGIYRFLGKVYRYATRNLPLTERSGESDRKVLRKLHQTIQKITEDFETRWHFNTYIASIMELMNLVADEKTEATTSAPVTRQVIENVALLLGPFAPYLSQEIWEEAGHEGVLFRESWPTFDPELAKDDEAEVVVQVNGKLRSRILTPFGMGKDELQALALADEKVRPFVNGKQVVKVIVVPDKLVNIVVR